MTTVLNVQKVLGYDQVTEPNVLYFVKDGALNLAVKQPNAPGHAIAVRRIFLSGPVELYQSLPSETVTGQYLIKNYSEFEEYEVSVTAGSVSRVGNVITVTAPQPAEDIWLIVNGESSKIRILENGYLKPSILYPLSGVENTELTLTVEMTEPVISHGEPSYVETEVQIATDAAFTQNVQSFFSTYGDEVELTNLQTLTLYYTRTRHIEAVKGPSPWSDVVTFKTKELFQPMNELAKITSMLTNPEDWLGRVVAVNNNADYVIAGARQDDTVANNAGAAYIFVRSGGVWIQSAKLLPADGMANDNFGTYVDIAGDHLTVVVSAYKQSSLGANAGAAYVYEYQGGQWVQTAKLTAPDALANDFFGWCVSISDDGNLIAVGARNKTGAATGSGAVYLYQRTSGWSFRQKLVASNPVAGAYFGQTVELSNDGAVLAVGAPYETTTASYAGATYLFEEIEGVWTEVARLLPGDINAIDYFGTAIALNHDGSKLAITSSFKDAGRGAVYLFERSGGLWVQEAKLQPISTKAVYFGWSLDFDYDGSILAIGSYGDLDIVSGGGAAYLYTKMDNVWSSLQKMHAIDTASGDYFGYSVSINGSGTRLAVGAFRTDNYGSNSGSVYLFGS